MLAWNFFCKVKLYFFCSLMCNELKMLLEKRHILIMLVINTNASINV